MLEQYFDEYMQLHPSFASYLGNRSKDGEYENYLSKAHTILYKTLLNKYKKRLEQTQISPTDLEMQTLQWVVNDSLNLLNYTYDYTPITSFENPVLDFSFQNQFMYPLRTSTDVLNLIRRHERFLMFIDCAIGKMKEGIEKCIVLPRIICERVITSLKQYMRNKNYLVLIPRSCSTDLKTKYEKVMCSFKNKVKRLLRFLEHTYIKECRYTEGLSHIPRGKSVYRYYVKSMTTLNVTPEYLHSLGLREVARLNAELNKIKTSLGYPTTMPLHEFYRKVLMDERNYFGSNEELMRVYKSTQNVINKKVIPKYFSADVKDYLLKEIPKSLEKTSAAAFYFPGSVINDERVGTFFINMRDLHENPKYCTMALSLHEGKPGHHYQFQYMIERKVPIHKMYAVDGTAFIEGWALYAESLGDYDFKKERTIMDYFGKLTFEIFRAVRLVVDTGIHYYGWTYHAAVEYMMQHLALSKAEIETEVERYICIPGQALCYKVGEITILKLRDMYMKRYGYTESNMKKFHDLVLEDGVLPLTILQKKIKRALVR